MAAGFAHPKCFARDLNDCSRKISREHFISRGLMSIIGASKSSTLRGPAWMEGADEMVISTESLSSNILCEKHNSDLSTFDEEMIKFIGHLTGQGTQSGALELSGNLIEKWFLKAYSGFLASGYAHKNLRGWPASETTLGILFGNKNLASDCGLYFLSGSHQDEQNALAFFPLQGLEPRSVAGIAFLISGFPFLFLVTRPWPELVRNISPLRMRYRPQVINIRHGKNELEVETGWRTGEIVEIDISDPF